MNQGRKQRESTDQDHVVRIVDLHVAVGTMAMAQALRPRLEALVAAHFPGVLAEVFDSLAIGALVLEVDALELDLGLVRADTLEEDALAALRRILPQALSAALVKAQQGDRADARLRAASAGRLARLEAFLLSGVLAFPDRGAGFDLTEEVRYLAVEQPAALVAMARTHVQNRRFLERLVLQSDTRALMLWLRLLAPADAFIILALVLDIQRVHRRVPIAALGRLSEGELRQMLWVTTLEFLLRDAGSDFNRRRFLAALIGREAVRLGLSLDALLELLAEAVTIAAARTPLRSSLPGTLWALLAERRGRDYAIATVAKAGAEDVGDKPLVVRGLPVLESGRAALARWAGDLHHTAFAALLQRIAPDIGVQLATGLALIDQLHRATPLLPISGSALVRRLRAAMLASLLAGPVHSGDARTVWRQVLHTLARQSAIDPDALIERVEGRILQSSTDGPGDPPTPGGRVVHMAAWSAAIPVDQAGRLLAMLEAGATGDMVLAAAGAGAERAFESLLAQLVPGDAARLSDGVAFLIAQQAASPFVELNAVAFKAVLRAALLDALIVTKGHVSWRIGSVWKAVVLRLAEAAGQSQGAMASSLRAARRSGLTRAGHTGTGRRRLVATYLRSGTPPSAGRALPDLAASDPDWLRSQVLALTQQAASNGDVLAGRLLDWLMPTELVALFGLPDADALLHAAPRGGGEERLFWHAWLITELRGQRQSFRQERRVQPAHRLDRIAALEMDLAGRVRAGGGAAVRAMPPDLLDLNPAELASVLLADDEVQTLARLVAATAALPSDTAEALLAGLAPWAERSEAVLAALDAMPDAAIRRTILLRSAAAGLAGCAVDGARLAEPIALAERPPQTRQTAHAGVAPGDAPAAALDAEVLFAWLDGAAASAADADALVTLFSRLADANDAGLTAYLKARRGLGRARLRWVTILPLPAVGRLIHLLVPAEAPALIDGALLLATAWRQTATFGSPRRTPQDLWKLLLDRIAEPRMLSVPRLLDELIGDLAGKDADRLARVRRQTEKLASVGGYATLAAALRRGGAAPRKRDGAVAQTAADASSPDGPKQTLYVGNAGLVLLNPFLPTLFERLDLLTTVGSERPSIADGEVASRAVHLLQYLADGRLDRPEPELVLNKLLCGLPMSEPLARSITPTPSDLAICDDLLRAVIGNWPRLDQMTPDALQETFLVREGRLQRGEGKWLLHVQRKTLDVLTDQLPWAFSVVYHRWMAEPIHVTW